MANTLITPSIIAKEALMQLENNLVMGNLVHRAYKREFVKVGSTVSIRKPVKFVASDGATRVNQDVSESTTSIVINKQKHVSWGFSSADLTLTIEQYSERYIRPAMIALANQVDYDLTGLYSDLFVATGTAGTTPSAFSNLGAAAQKMDEFGVPDDGNRVVVLDPAARWAMASTFAGLYQTPDIVEGAFRRGYLGQVANFKIYGDQNIRYHTKGTAETSGAWTVNGASQTGSTVIMAGTGSTDTVVAGDIITLAGAYAVNPVSRAAYSFLKQFVITSGGTISGGAITINVAPSIITSGAYQTVSASPDNGGAFTIESSHRSNMAFHKNCFALVMVPLELPDGAPFKAREEYNNLSVRVVKDYDIDLDQDVIRLDILYGYKTIYPELGVVMMG